MTPESARAERLIDLVEATLALEPAARAAYLDGQCGPDLELRSEVDSLLSYEDHARDFISTSAIHRHANSLLDHSSPAQAVLKPGDLVGSHRILSLLGEGGMGEVYLAEDPDLGERKVAIKVVKRGVASDALLRHFQQERLILASLNHPHIARLYGGAVTADGMPYFVMEYVEGESIHAYCDRRKLNVPARLALFRKVCTAVAYAHRHLVVHRDIKPANIRVTPEGEPKLLDFGIAKLMSDPQTVPAHVEQTVTLFAALTPAYASPEQLRGESMTTATDIYSLGVVLYELLSGCPPFDLRGKRPGEVTRLICEQNIERPSSTIRLATTQRQAEIARERSTTLAAQVSRQLTGDLDNIVLMALRKEPERRYGAVSQFSEDLQRHLDGRPVTARRETLRYVGAKFIRRNKAVAAVALLLVLSLVGGIVTTSWQARRAEQQRRRAEGRFEDVRRLADALLFEIHDAVQNLPGSTPTRQLIVSRALEYLDGLTRDADTPALRRNLANAYEKIGDIQGNPYSANLGDTDGALASYRKAEALRESLRGAQQTKEARLEWGRSGRSVGDILEVKGRYTEMIHHYRRSLDIFQSLQRDHPADREVRDEHARAYDVLGDGLDRIENGRAERLASYERSLLLRQELLRDFPVDLKIRRSVATEYAKTGLAAMPDKARAVDLIRRGVERLKALSQEQPDNARARREFAWGLFSLGNVLAEAGDHAAALGVRREVLPIREEIATADPKNKQAQFDLAATHADLAEALTGTGDPAQALGHAQRAVESMEALWASDPSNVSFTHNTAFAYDHLAHAHAALAARSADEDTAERREHWLQALSWYEKERAVFMGLRERGALRPASAGKVEALEAEVTRCRAEWGKAGVSSQL